MKMTPTFIHYHPSHTKVKPFAGQRQYLHFSATLRPWVLVWSQGLNQGPPALQWSAVSTKLALHYCQTLTEKPKHLKYFRKVCVMNNNSRDQKRQTSHQAQTNSRLWFKLNFLTTISGVWRFSLSTPFPAPNPLPLLACESRCLFSVFVSWCVKQKQKMASPLTGCPSPVYLVFQWVFLEHTKAIP